jgi:hypothetical protein
MKRLVSSALVFCLMAGPSVAAFADVQYTEQSKITGGAAAGAMKFAGVFSKDARQATQGSTETISVKGNKMRQESSLGTATIYDLDARKIINIDLKHKTYSVTTFDEMRRQMEEARRKAEEKQAKSHKGDAQQVKIIPKIKVTPGSGSKQILNYTAKEQKTQIDMEMQAQDEKHNTQNGNMWVNADTYVAPVKGYDEVKRFYARLAKELDWVPGTIFGGNSNVQIGQPMIEYRKSLTTMNGMPLLSYVSVGSGPNPGTTGQAAASQPEKKSGNVVSRGLGGMFGKKQKEDSSQQSIGAGTSLMDMTTEVTSFKAAPVDASLFTIPAGFKEVEAKKGE